MAGPQIKIDRHPPKPALCLRVGVTGHRVLGDEAKGTNVERQLRAVLSQLKDGAVLINDRWRACFAGNEARLRLISPLAYGADSLAARAALDLGYGLQALTPFPVARYREDFAEFGLDEFESLLARANAVFQLDGDDSTPETQASAYLACGQLTVSQCDILIAVWDGAAARGIGGTAMIIETALRSNVPVIWIHASGNDEPCFVKDDFGRGGSLSQLPEILTRLFAPPFAEMEVDDIGVANWRSADMFWGESERRGNYGVVFGAFETLLTGRKPSIPKLKIEKYAAKTSREWAPYFERVGEFAGDAVGPLRDILAARFCWADNLAMYYAKLYRSSYTLNYLLSALAVALALAEIVVGFGKEAFIATELVVILLILFITVAGRRGGWHEKWIDYRQLAEQLRHIRFLYLAGGVSSDSSERHDYSHGGSHGSWVQWFNQATIREIGLASVLGDRKFIDQVRALFVETELDDQKSYHESNIIRMERIEHALHRAGDLFFGMTLAACVLYLAVYGLTKVEAFIWAKPLKYEIKGWVTVLTALLPAVGAPMLGIRVQGEFSSTAERSEAMAERLGELAHELHKLDDKSLTMAALRAYVESAAETMLIEVVDWRFVFRGKPLGLPA